MKTACLFPGQGSQFPGMGRNLYESDSSAAELMNRANGILGYSLTELMFEGPAEKLTQTNFTQPAIFLHSVALFQSLKLSADMGAGHSLGEFSALVAAGAIEFDEGLQLVSLRGDLMQGAGEENSGTMAALVGLDDESVEAIAEEATRITNKPVVTANYNCPGQLVISGDLEAVEKAMELARERGCRLAKKLNVSGAFHSPLMQNAYDGLKKRLDTIKFNPPVFPIYCNMTANATTDPVEIKQNLLEQLVNPVRWTQSMLAMESDGANHFVEVGPGAVLQGLVKRTLKDVDISGHQ